MYKIGDEVRLKIVQSILEDVINYRMVKVQVIGVPDSAYPDEYEMYLCYVPHCEHVTKSFKLTKAHQRSYRFPDKFLNEYGTFINGFTETYGVDRTPVGATCGRCKTFVHLAEQSYDGFTCAACKDDPYRGML